MQYSKFYIKCEFLEKGTLNTFKGSAIRGAFGHALKKAVCTVRDNDCISCILQRQCLFAKFYLDQKEGNEKAPSKIHPFIIEPPFEIKKEYQKGEEFLFSIILLGNSYEMLPFIIYAFEIMGNKGIGRSLEKNEEKIIQNTPFIIKDILVVENGEKQSIYNTVKKQIISSPSPYNLVYQPVINGKTNQQELTLTLETPLRFKNENNLSSTLDFMQLLRLMVRRISSVFREYEDKNFYIDIKPLLAIAEKVCIVHSSLHWEEQTRYSSRQRKVMKFGGLLGTITYQGNFQEFVPLLDLATLLHLGKQTSFGLGKINYQLKDL